jgi:hypothetical protein
MGRTTYTGFSRPDFLADQSSAERTSGRQIAWDEVDASFDGADGKAFIPSGHPVTDAADGKRIIPVVAANDENAWGLLEGPAHEDDEVSGAAPLTGYGVIVGGVVYEQLIPGLSADAKTALSRFFFEEYADSRAEPAS